MIVLKVPDCFAAYDVLIDHTCVDLNSIPEAAVTLAKSSLHIAYQHTSHGSQLITGMNSLESFPLFENRYEWSDNGASGLDLDDYGIPGCDDLSQGDYIDANGVTPWVTATRALLDNGANSHINVIAWSWCSIKGHNAQRYVDNMEVLIGEYGEGGSKVGVGKRPPVKFVFMTGHAEGDGENMAVNGIHYNNELIRNHCRTHNRILFDFADIEAWNPGGSYFWNLAMTDNLDYSGGNWAVEWIGANPGSELEQLTTGSGVAGYGGCSGCAHSSSPEEANLNCILKARGAWWLWARISGWDGPQVSQGCPDCSGDTVVLTGATFDANTDCECNATSSITLGANVVVRSSARVRIKAPLVTIQPGLLVEAGADFKTGQ
ncbi:MAG: hypothetical protein V1793_09720 [Pseudomonadota bacterium]